MADSPIITPEAPVVTPETPASKAPEVKVVATPAADKAPGSKERMYKVKINGKEEVWPESKVLERAQKSEGAEVAMKRASQLEAAFENFVATSQDPLKLIELLSNPKALGYDESKQVALFQAMMASKKPAMVQAVKKWLYDNEVEPSTLTPEERKMRELEAFKTETEKKNEERTRLEEEANQKAETERFFNDYKKKIWDGIQANKLPQTELMVARVTRKIQLMRKAGIPGDVAKACEFVRQELTNEYSEHLLKASDEDILNLLPVGVAEKVNKAYLKRLKGEDPDKIESGGSPSPRKKDKGPNLMEKLRQVERGRSAF